MCVSRKKVNDECINCTKYLSVFTIGSGGYSNITDYMKHRRPKFAEEKSPSISGVIY